MLYRVLLLSVQNLVLFAQLRVLVRHRGFDCTTHGPYDPIQVNDPVYLHQVDLIKPSLNSPVVNLLITPSGRPVADRGSGMQIWLSNQLFLTPVKCSLVTGLYPPENS